MNPFDKPFNDWTVEDFQNALKITKSETKTTHPAYIGLPIPPIVDLVELEQGEFYVVDNKHTRMKTFHRELQEFINTLRGKNGKLYVKEIKRAIAKLPKSHPVHTTYRAFLEKCNWEARKRKIQKYGVAERFWDLTDYDRISKHLKYMNNYNTEYSHSARLSWGGGKVKVHKKYIRTN